MGPHRPHYLKRARPCASRVPGRERLTHFTYKKAFPPDYLKPRPTLSSNWSHFEQNIRDGGPRGSHSRTLDVRTRGAGGGWWTRRGGTARDWGRGLRVVVWSSGFGVHGVECRVHSVMRRV